MNERIDTVLAHLGISHLRDRDTFHLSGGEKQKVALAGALVMEPSILLLDEPLASLDPASAQEALKLFRRLADEGKTIIIVEHRVEAVLSINPDKVLYMEESELRYLGEPDGLIAHVNFEHVKLPAQTIMERVRATGKQVAPYKIPLAQEDAEDILVVEDVNFAYPDGPQVLHDINLNIRRGDIIAVLGPNGAGKSTLVKHAIGLLKPKTGQVLLFSEDTRKLSVAENAKSVGYVFQSPTQMLFAATVNEELAFGPKNLEMPEDEIAVSVQEAVKTLNLVGLEDFSPLALSFGQQKRTGIASILAMRSSILVMDEPTAGQDYATYTRFMRAIVGDEQHSESVISRFAATLFITHDLDLAVMYANRVILVNEGRIAADGDPQQVLSDQVLLDHCRVIPTSLLKVNLEMLPQTNRFMSADALAAFYV
jgi:energy-coupling factor transport system ATP-binding protein